MTLPGLQEPPFDYRIRPDGAANCLVIEPMDGEAKALPPALP